MNHITLIGRLCNDVEHRSTQTGKTVATYRLAVDRPYKREGQPDADFFTCVAFDKNGDFAVRFLKKGTKIAIEGSVQTRSYNDKDGKKVYVTEVIVDRHEFCESKQGGNSNAFAQEAATAGFVVSDIPDAWEEDTGEILPF